MNYVAFVPKYHEVPDQLVAVLVPSGTVTREIWEEALALRIESLALSEESRHTLLSELEWRVMPPLVLDQAKLYMRDEAPVAYVSWARLSDAAAARYQQAPHHLTSGDWQSGSQNWLIDLCTPFGGGSDIITELRQTVFKGQPLHQFSLGANGQLTTMTWPAVAS